MVQIFQNYREVAFQSEYPELSPSEILLVQIIFISDGNLSKKDDDQ